MSKFYKSICLFIVLSMVLSLVCIYGSAGSFVAYVGESKEFGRDSVNDSQNPIKGDANKEVSLPDEESTFNGTAIVPTGSSDKGNNTETQEYQIVDENQTSEFTTSIYSMTGFKEIFFYDMFPSYLDLRTSWDPLGIDDNGIVYFGFTSNRKDIELEDFAVFSYNPELDAIKFIGTFIETSKACNNYVEGEPIPKGHTKFMCVDGKLYMASQNFHDYKDKITGYEDNRGAHLYMYDPEKGTFLDISADMPNGVWCEHEGVVAMNYMPELNMLVGLTHPLSNLVFYDLTTKKVDRYVQGIPWSLGNPLGREVVVVGDRVYLYRGIEETSNAWLEKEFPLYYYDYGDNETVNTGVMMKGGFWNGQATTSDNKTTYISTCGSYLYKLDRETGEITFLRTMDRDGEDILGYTYSISLSPDETKIIYVPSAMDCGVIYEYDIATGKVSLIANIIGKGIYGGSNIVTKDNWYYFTRFGTDGNWEGLPALVAFQLVPSK